MTARWWQVVGRRCQHFAWPCALHHHAPREEDGASARRRAGQQRQPGRATSKASGPKRFWSGGRLDARGVHGPNVRHCGKRCHAGLQDRDTVDGTPLCVAEGGVIPQLLRGDGDVHSGGDGLGDVPAPQEEGLGGSHQVRRRSARDGTCRPEGRGPRRHPKIGVDVLRSEESVAALLWHIPLGGMPCFVTVGQHVLFSCVPMQRFHRSRLRHGRPHHLPGHAVGASVLAEKLQAGEGPSRSDACRPAFVLGPRGEVTTPQAADTKILPSRELNEPHLVTQRSMRPSATDVMLSCSSWKRYSLNVTLKVFSSRRAGAGSKAAAVL